MSQDSEIRTKSMIRHTDYCKNTLLPTESNTKPAACDIKLQKDSLSLVSCSVLLQFNFFEATTCSFTQESSH